MRWAVVRRTVLSAALAEAHATLSRAALAALAACALAAPQANAAAQVTAVRTLSPRLQELTLRTSALAAPTRVRVLLPAGYATSRRRYPVLYLLHGAAGDEGRGPCRAMPSG